MSINILIFWFQGETPLHLACLKGLTELVEVLLDKGANPNSQTHTPSTGHLGLEEETTPVSQQTPLHLALVNNHSSIVELFLQHKSKDKQMIDLIDFGIYLVIFVLHVLFFKPLSFVTVLGFVI